MITAYKASLDAILISFTGDGWNKGTFVVKQTPFAICSSRIKLLTCEH